MASVPVLCNVHEAKAKSPEEKIYAGIYLDKMVQESKVNRNEETRLRNLLLKKADGKHLKPLDLLYLNKLSLKKARESAPLDNGAIQLRAPGGVRNLDAD